MIKEFLMRKMMEKQLKNVSKEDQDKMIALVTKNPELFQRIAKEVQEKTEGANGQPRMDQMKATLEVMKQYENELRGLTQ